MDARQGCRFVLMNEPANISKHSKIRFQNKLMQKIKSNAKKIESHSTWYLNRNFSSPTYCNIVTFTLSMLSSIIIIIIWNKSILWIANVIWWWGSCGDRKEIEVVAFAARKKIWFWLYGIRNKWISWFFVHAPNRNHG